MLRTLILIGLLAASPKPAGVVIEDAWVREAPPSATAMAAYLTIKNPGMTAMKVIGASSPEFDSVELHEIVEVNGLTAMREVKSLPLNAGRKLSFVPGGTHVMLIGPKAPLKAGAAVTITFMFEGGATTTVKTTVKPRVVAPKGHDHQH